VTEPGGRAPTPPATPPDDSRATVAGVILVAFALLIGAVLLAKGFSDDGGLTNTAATSDQSDGGNGQGFDVPSTTTTLAPVDPATVKVFVANASGTKSGAKLVGDYLGTKGFTGVQIGNAPNQVQTVIYVTAGNAAQGQAVAASLGLDPAVVAAMPTTPPVNDLKGADVLVVIGTDGQLANPGATTTTTAGSDTTDTSAPD
jgi:hypothetical protein